LTTIAVGESMGKAYADVVRFEDVSHLNEDPAFDIRQNHFEIFICTIHGSAICRHDNAYNDQLQQPAIERVQALANISRSEIYAFAVYKAIIRVLS